MIGQNAIIICNTFHLLNISHSKIGQKFYGNHNGNIVQTNLAMRGSWPYMLFSLSHQAIFIRVKNGHTCWVQFVPFEKYFQNLFHPWLDVYNKRSNLQSTFILASFTMVLFLCSKWWVQSFYLDALFVSLYFCDYPSY